MVDEKKQELAQQVYKTLCQALDNRKWRYEVDESKLLVHFGVNGDDIPIKIIMFVDAERQLVRLLSPLSFDMSEDKRMDGAIATCVATYKLADGSFDYNLSDGKIVFRMAASFRDSIIGDGLIQHMISCACVVVDEYNDKFLAVEKGIISINDFIAKEA